MNRDRIARTYHVQLFGYRDVVLNGVRPLTQGQFPFQVEGDVLGERARVKCTRLDLCYSIFGLRREIGSQLQVRRRFGLFQDGSGRPFDFRRLGPLIRRKDEVSNGLHSRQPIKVFRYLLLDRHLGLFRNGNAREASQYYRGRLVREIIRFRALRGDQVLEVCQWGQYLVLTNRHDGRFADRRWHFLVNRYGNFSDFCNVSNQLRANVTRRHNRCGIGELYLCRLARHFDSNVRLGQRVDRYFLRGSVLVLINCGRRFQLRLADLFNRRVRFVIHYGNVCLVRVEVLLCCLGDLDAS